jgi:hypothetical protein
VQKIFFLLSGCPVAWKNFVLRYYGNPEGTTANIFLLHVSHKSNYRVYHLLQLIPFSAKEK